MTAEAFGPVDTESSVFDLENAVYKPVQNAQTMKLSFGLKPRVESSMIESIILGVTNIPTIEVKEFDKDGKLLYEVGLYM